MKPLVSVVVITYQHANYIKQCLDSILNQKTSFEFEIILGEDGSVDGTREICSEYADKFPGKIRLFLRSREDVISIMGQPTGRYNFVECLKVTQGKYVALCEGDDYWTSTDKRQKQVDVLEANMSHSLCFHKILVDDGSDVLKSDEAPAIPEHYQSIETFAEKGNYINTSSVLFRNVIREFPSRYYEAPIGDFFLYILLLEHGTMIYLDEPMAVYRKGVGIWSVQKLHVRQYKKTYCFRLLYEYFYDRNAGVANIFLERIKKFLSSNSSKLSTPEILKLSGVAIDELHPSTRNTLTVVIDSMRIPATAMPTGHKGIKSILSMLVHEVRSRVKTAGANK